ncbi:MAG: hypothetical protein ACE14P_08620 [Methanotrichaceae archaeon]
MKGVVAAMLIAALLTACGIVAATAPIVPPVQYEQFCESQKVSGTGVIDVSTSIVDKKIALEYYNTMSGYGDLELNQENAYSQNADKLKRNISSVNGGDKANLNLYNNEKITYSGTTPLSGGKYLKSKEFYGGMGADIQEIFSVNQMEKDQTTFFTSTAPYNPAKPCSPVPCYPPMSDESSPQIYPMYYPDVSSGYSPEQLVKDLKSAGRDQDKVAELMGNNPSHLIGMETKNTFNGTWGTDATWHKIFYKDIKAHEMFTGQFEADKTIKFHENPVPEAEHPPCEGIDC